MLLIGIRMKEAKPAGRGSSFWLFVLPDRNSNDRSNILEILFKLPFTTWSQEKTSQELLMLS